MMFQRMRPVNAIIWTVMGGYMLLPVKTGLDFPLVPTMDKLFVINLTVAIMCAMVLRTRLQLLPRAALGKVLMLLFISTPFFTVLTNGDPIFTGSKWLRALSIHDAFSLLVRQCIMLAPFMVGRQYLATAESHRVLILALATAGAIYSLPMLLEIRLSPQLHNWVYGFFPHSFSQQVRFGGYRPVVFMGHGLLVALFFALTLVAAGAAWRAKERILRVPPAMLAMYMAVVLVLCKSIAALVLGLGGLVVARFASIRLQLLFCAFAAGTALFYPMLRGADLIPTQDLVEFARGFDAARGQSLEFRFNNEDLLLERANQKPLFGWGSAGRNNVHDPVTGKSLVTDGKWVITIGLWGWYGYIAEFGLLTLPLLLLYRRARKRTVQVTMATTALCLVHALNLLDLLPNASATPLTFLIAGALFGYAETVTRTAPNVQPRAPVATFGAATTVDRRTSRKV